ncbi:CRISPR-associated helicase/endonuclease Cas3 [Actinoalloteichus hymeniacidonis]|uniref:CRISPR-associated helicase/endonuclease Cas3 n=1 Tax=Actinoalloteichus hymeniacidonis TaxID=340345 RepID=UPI000853A49E|nr:CRISPR-associated helicase/endonuclease Cas3 [Actinoalloteichus hymeniacidonis]MBB5907120.1 CRISPR-associated endonuclease/helicase Cas3 [Actinoalloteichus hymeniacidonis]
MTEQPPDFPPKGRTAADGDREQLWLWAKAGKGSVPHPLICHALDTAAVAYQLYPVLLGSAIRMELTVAFGEFEGIGDAEENARRWVAVLCGLHDLGKASPAFQALRYDLIEKLYKTEQSRLQTLKRVRPTDGPRVDAPHGWITHLHLDRLLRLAKASPSILATVAPGLAGHHGVIPDAARRSETAGYPRDHGGKVWEQIADQLVDRLVELCGLSHWQLRPWSQAYLGLAGAIGLTGLASVSDWIASNSRNFPWAGVDFELVEYAPKTAALAHQAIHAMRWTKWTPPEDTRFSTLFPGTEDAPTPPRPVQVAAERMLADVTEPGLLIVEAPTGEGKTKLGFQAAARLVSALGLAGLYQGMPTRATGDQAFEEFDDFAAGYQADLRVRLLHGAADQHPRIKERNPPTKKGEAKRLDPEAIVDVGPDHPEEDITEVREWFAGKRGIIVPVGIGTVDQMLMGMIRARHSFVRLTGLSNKVLILDEVHGYDIYMSTLIDCLIEWAGRLGIPMILMSATLPSGRKSELIRAWRAGRLGRPVTEVPLVSTAQVYPELTWADAAGVRTWSDLPTDPGASRVSQRNGNRIIEVDLNPLAGDDADQRAEWLLDQVDLAPSARPIGIAVVHNLVRRVGTTAAALRRAIKRRGGKRRYDIDLITITGRMSVAERGRANQAVKDSFGRGVSRSRPTIVIGTQVLEQGLDVSFDLMVSDLAPIDCLVQRAGRVLRHEDRGAAPLTVRLVITGPTWKGERLEFPRYTVGIYPALLLLRTWLLLRALPTTDSGPEAATGDGVRLIRCPEDLRGLVDRLYAEDFDLPVPAGWAKDWAKAKVALDKRFDDDYRARSFRIPTPSDGKVFQRLTNDPTRANRTRKEGRPDDHR